jgi:small subunit ribosomal protein S15
MSITKARFKEIVTQYGENDQDTGSAPVQIAMLTERIRNLTDHVKIHKKDHHTRRGLLMLVGQRRRLQKYYEGVNLDAYRQLIKDLGLRR